MAGDGTRTRTVTLGALLVVLGALCWVLHGLQARTERHSFARGGLPPTAVSLTADHRYWISLPGGIDRELALGVQPGTLRCTLTAPGGAARLLTVTAEQEDSRAVHQIASFVAPRGGRFTVGCAGLPANELYVDDADDATPDLSVLWLVLACLLLAVGVPVLLSGLRGPRSATAAPDYEHV